MPPKHLSGYSVALLINTTANYWKHYQEDVDYPFGSLHKSTIKILEDLGLSIEAPYICELVLDRIVETEINPFTKIIGFLNEWRENLIKNANKRL